MKFQRLIIVCIAIVYPLSLHAEVTVKGVESKIADNIKAHLAISREPCDAPAWRLQQRRRDINQQASQALQAFGFYRATVKQNFTKTDKCWQLQLDVTAGPQIHLRNIDIQLLNRPAEVYTALLALINQPALQKDAPLNHQVYDSYKSQLLNTAQVWGYWQAQFEQAELAIYPQEEAADVHLHFNLGPRYRFGPYIFSPTQMDNDLVERLAEPLEGKPYSLEGIQDSYSRLHGSEYFRQVVISPQLPEDKSNTVVPLKVDLAMNNQHSIGAGVGYSTDQGPRVHTNYRNRYYNSAGYKFDASALWSPKLKQLSGTFTIPREDAAKEWYELSAGFKDEITATYTTINQSFNVRAISSLPHDWIMNTGFNILKERYIVANQPEEQSTLHIPGIGFSWTSAEETSRQTRGLSFEAGLTTSHQLWLSDLDYVQGYTRTKGIFSPTRRLRVISRLELAGTMIDDFETLPVSVRYFAGGDNSVRGYEYKSLGEQDADGHVIGGGRLAVGSTELDYLLVRNWSASVFYDVGDAYNEQPNFNESWGMGIRWYSPVGALRVDIAFPQQSDEDYRLHISVGADL